MDIAKSYKIIWFGLVISVAPNFVTHRGDGHIDRGSGHRQRNLSGGTGYWPNLASKEAPARPKDAPTTAASNAALLGATLGLTGASWRSILTD